MQIRRRSVLPAYNNAKRPGGSPYITPYVPQRLGGLSYVPESLADLLRVWAVAGRMAGHARGLMRDCTYSMAFDGARPVPACPLSMGGQSLRIVN